MTRGRRISGAVPAVLLLAAPALWVRPAARPANTGDVGFFSKQRVLERLGETKSTADQRADVTPRAAVDTGADIERRVGLTGRGAADPISPAEVEGALDAAFAPLVSPVAPAAAAQTLPGGPARERCAVVRSAPDRGWGLMGKLDGQTFTWVDGVGKLRSLTYRLTPDGAAMVLSLSVAGRMRPVDTYRKVGRNLAGVSTVGAHPQGTIRLSDDEFTFEAAHEIGKYVLNKRCDLVLKGSLRFTGRPIEDVFFNTTDGADTDQEQVIRDRSATRIARLRGSAVIGLARHS